MDKYKALGRNVLVMKSNLKIYYSEIGGVFIGKGIQSDYQRNHLIKIIISFHEPFKITQPEKEDLIVEAALILANAKFKIQTSQNDYTAFLHIDPYSDIGLLIQNSTDVAELPRSVFKESLNEFSKWLSDKNNDNTQTENLIRNMVHSLPPKYVSPKKIDMRVIECMKIINESEVVNFDDLASHLSLSSSRLSHLFKEETNLTLKKYIQHRKLIKSIHGLQRNLNFTEAAFYGGFYDQPHFIKIFKKMFGIRPSKIKP